tara:strand:- start:325 stop:555 length:231 start_codon:yes stop_codon:yes gene_type:complete
MVDNYSREKLYLTKHSLDGVKEYYGTDCIGMMLEVTISITNKTTEKLLKYRDLPREAFCSIFRTNDCNEKSLSNRY